MNGMFRYLLIFLMLFTGSAHTAADDDFDAVKKAAEQGHANAQARIGAMYAMGEGVPENDIQAYAWISIAAAQGDARYRSRYRSRPSSWMRSTRGRKVLGYRERH